MSAQLYFYSEAARLLNLQLEENELFSTLGLKGVYEGKKVLIEQLEAPSAEHKICVEFEPHFDLGLQILLSEDSRWLRRVDAALEHEQAIIPIESALSRSFQLRADEPSRLTQIVNHSDFCGLLEGWASRSDWWSDLLITDESFLVIAKGLVTNTEMLTARLDRVISSAKSLENTLGLSMLASPFRGALDSCFEATQELNLLLSTCPFGLESRDSPWVSLRSQRRDAGDYWLKLSVRFDRKLPFQLTIKHSSWVDRLKDLVHLKRAHTNFRFFDEKFSIVTDNEASALAFLSEPVCSWLVETQSYFPDLEMSENGLDGATKAGSITLSSIIAPVFAGSVALKHSLLCQP